MIVYPIGVGGLVTRVLEAGTGDRTVVLIHGVGARADRWRPTLEPLAAAGFHCYALDLPGHGFAEKRADFEYTVPAFAAFVETFIANLKSEKAVLIGTSLGGHIAAHIACKAPTKVSALVLAGSTGLFPIGAEACNRMADRMRDRSLDGTVAKLRNLFFDARFATSELAEEDWRINNSPGTDAVFEKLESYFRTGLDSDAIEDRLSTLRHPVLLIWGEQEKSVPISIGRKAMAALPNATLVTIEGAAHAPQIEQADKVNAEILGFLRTVAAST